MRSNIQRKSKYRKESREYKRSENLTNESRKSKANNFSVLSKSVDSNGKEERAMNSLKKRSE